MAQTNSIISLESNSGNQMIYATQLYGSFFSIYGEFKSKVNNKHYEINDLLLTIVMYKGLLNIGISKAELKSNGNGLDLIIEVQAAPNFDIKLPVKVSIHPDCKCPIKGGTLKIVRVVKKIHDRPVNKVNHYVVENIFDDEFYYREGNEDKRERSPKIGTWENPNPEGEPWDGNLRCPRATHKIV